MLAKIGWLVLIVCVAMAVHFVLSADEETMAARACSGEKTLELRQGCMDRVLNPPTAPPASHH